MIDFTPFWLESFLLIELVCRFICKINIKAHSSESLLHQFLLDEKYETSSKSFSAVLWMNTHDPKLSIIISMRLANNGEGNNVIVF